MPLRKKTIKKSLEMFNIDNKSVNKNEIAEGFNNSFAGIGYNVNHNVPRADRDFMVRSLELVSFVFPSSQLVKSVHVRRKYK